MKRIFFLLYIVLLFLLVSCATSVSVNTLVPATVNIGADKMIGISRVVPFWSPRLEPDTYRAASYAEKVIEKALKQGVYPVMDVKSTDAIIQSAKVLNLDPTEQLIRAGVKVLVQASIDSMDCYDTYHEDVRVDSRGKPVLSIYAEKNANLAISFVVWDLETLSIIDSFSFYDKKSSDTEGVYRETTDGRKAVKPEDRDYKSIELLESILDSFKYKIRDRLVAHYETSYFSLKKDKTKSKYLEKGYEMAKNGDWRNALSVFLNDWEKTGNFTSGYNAAVIQYSLGNYEDAISLANDVYESTGNREVLDLSLEFSEMLNRQKEAFIQVNGSDKSEENTKIIY